MDRDDGFGGRHEEGGTRTGRTGGWRDAFLNRHKKGNDTSNDDLGLEREHREPRIRSVSRPRASSRPPREGPHNADSDVAGTRSAAVENGNGFNQQAVLDQDRALIEQLTQKQPRRERSVVRKPPPPPKVTPYRTRSASTPNSERREGDTAPPSPAGSSKEDSASVGLHEAHASVRQAGVAAAVASSPLVASGMCSLRSEENLHSPLRTPDHREDLHSPHQAPSAHGPPVSSQPCSAHLPPRPTSNGAIKAATEMPSKPAVGPIVPQSGELFTASDIDSIMDKLTSRPAKDSQLQGSHAESVNRGGNAHAEKNVRAPTGAPASPGQCTQNFGDISEEFFRAHRMEVPAKAEPQKETSKQGAHSCQSKEIIEKEIDVPSRKALKQQIDAIDSWLEDDFTAREQLSERKKQAAGIQPSLYSVPPSAPESENLAAGKDGTSPAGVEAEIFAKLEDVKKRKYTGQRVSPPHLKTIATQVKPLLPGMTLDSLIRALRLFTSARHEDHDLYLRILGEIPVQIRGVTPEQLVTCVRVLWRLRLHEETYLELFSMEAMNMIRAKRRSTPRAPRRPLAPRNVEAATTAAGAGGAAGPVPVPPPMPPPEAPSPFNATQLIHLGSSLSQVGAKHPTRFLEVYQEQLALAIPRFTSDECELVYPTLATSQLMHDPLRRAFLERCAQVGAGKPQEENDGQGAAPDIAQYQREAQHRKRREKHFRNIYIIEASVRKESFSFFSSLPAEVRSHLDKIHSDASKLKHQGQSTFATQIAAVLDQLGVSCDLSRMAGPLDLHVVAKATNPRAEIGEIFYECSDVDAFYCARQDDKGAPPQLTSFARLRHRLLQRLGIQLTHISIFEWKNMSEAQRINYMVKLQSL